MAQGTLKMWVRNHRKMTFSVLFITFLAVLAGLSGQFQILGFFEQKLLDFRFQMVSPDRKPSDQVIFVDIDDNALGSLSKDFGTWPWPRGDIMSTRIADFIAQGNPAAIFFDILYPEYSPKMPEDSFPEQDSILVNSAMANPVISHAVQFSQQDASSTYPALNPVTDASFRVQVAVEPGSVPTPRGADPTMPFAELTEFAQSLHTVNEAVDIDGVSRRYTLFMEYQGAYYPSMALKALVFKEGATDFRVQGSRFFYKTAAGESRQLPLTDDGRIQLSFYYNLDDFQHIPADSVIASAQLTEKGNPEAAPIPASAFEGKVIIIGATAQGLKDLKISPLGTNYGGPFLHATAISNLLSQHYLTRLPLWADVLILVLALVVVMTLSLALSQAFLRSVLGFLWILLVLGAELWVFYAFGLIIAMADTIVLTIVGLLGSVIFLSLTEGAEKRYIRNVFSTYLSPDVIKQLEADPNKLKLGGEKRDMTAMFTDVKGFSTFSERLDPNDLVHLLNEYLGAMSDIVLDNEGTIDKYEGDAIIAFWGAPMDQPDHANRAVRSAIAMRRCEVELNKRLIEAKIAPSPLHTRFGINSGDMTVGNMGTQRRMNYTIMGNQVNLSARLEGVNKQYGTWILTSESTKAKAGEGFLMRSLDRVRVVGIRTPVRLYEVVEEMGRGDPLMEEVVPMFEAGLAHYEAMRWKESRKLFEEVLRLRPDDGPAATFLERVRLYETTQPGADWDGVFNLNTK